MALQKTCFAKNAVRLKPFRAAKSGLAIAGPAGPPMTALIKVSVDFYWKFERSSSQSGNYSENKR